jgi:transposase InsO family protein
MTDGAWSYTHNRSLRELFARGIRHIITPPYTPRWNGKVERFHQTMEREWGPRACATATAKPETKHCHTGSATTTSADPTQPLTADHPSAALTTSQGRTAGCDASSGRPRPRRPRPQRLKRGLPL